MQAQYHMVNDNPENDFCLKRHWCKAADKVIKDAIAKAWISAVYYF